jgi:hypothetical protein
MYFGKHFAKYGGEGPSEVLVPKYKATKLRLNKTIHPHIKEN